MKKTLLLALLLMALISPAFAQWTVPTQTVQDSISGNVRWTNNQQYLLKGYVYVVNGATLTIDSGVTIRGDKATKGALIVERGAKIFANGTKEFPIIFTSNEAAGARNYGDWGGLIICGKSPTNWTTLDKQVEGGPRSLYGGTDPNDNSGRLSYVRIEFGGIAFSPNNEVNSLSLYGVGAGTQIDHVQASYSGDDGFEWFGGTVNAKYLVSLKAVDDDFDNDNNYSGKNQFCVVLREPYVADVSGSKAIESDAYLSGTYSGNPYVAAQGNTSVFSNMTIVGPQKTVNSTNHSVTNNTAAIHIRRGSGISVLNSIVLGFPVGLLLDESSSAYGSTIANITSGTLQFRNNIIAGNGSTGGPRDVFFVKDGARNLTPTTTSADTSAAGTSFAPFAGPVSFLHSSTFGNRVVPGDNNSASGLGLADPFNLGSPNLLPNASSAALSGADFTNSKASDAFFTPTTYVGAFGTTNWMEKWTEFNPINADYNKLRQAPASVKNISSLKMLSVFPNPAGTNAQVTFDLQEHASLTVGLFDITGKLVKEIFSGEKPSGAHALNMDLTALQAGYYFVRIATANGQQSVSLVVAK